MTETSPVGRYQILNPDFVTLPIPGQCILCGSHNRPVVTMQLVIRNYGTIMFCLLCTRSMLDDLGGAIGVTSIENFRRVRDEKDELYKELRRYKEAMSGIHGDLDAVLQRRLDSVAVGSDSGNHVGNSPAEDSGADKVSDGIDSGTVSEPDGKDSRTDDRSDGSSDSGIPSSGEFFLGDFETSR